MNHVKTKLQYLQYTDYLLNMVLILDKCFITPLTQNISNPAHCIYCVILYTTLLLTIPFLPFIFQLHNLGRIHIVYAEVFIIIK